MADLAVIGATPISNASEPAFQALVADFLIDLANTERPTNTRRAYADDLAAFIR